MMTESRTDIHPFQKLLEDLYNGMESHDGLKKARQLGWKRFNELGLPYARSEAYQYIRLRQLLALQLTPPSPTPLTHADIEPHVLLECQGSVLVFINGSYQSHLSHLHNLPKRAVVTSLHEAYRTFGTLLSNQWNKEIKEEKDPFAALNTAFIHQGLFIYAPPRTCFETPVQIINLIDTKDDSMLIQPRIQLFAGVHAEIKLVDTIIRLSGQNYLMNHLTDISLDEDAKLHYTQINIDQPQEGWIFDTTRATLKRNSHFKTVQVTEGAGTIRNDYHVVLTGENGEARLNGVCMLKDKKEAHTHVFVNHQAPSCQSMQLFKGVLNDTSRSSFEGKIFVERAAQKTQAFQLNNNLILSDYAIANSKPNLEIFADDVKASHGATVGQLDPEHIFYMKTRGFSEKDAKNILIHGFCQEVIDMIPYPSLHQLITERARNYIIQ